MRDPHPMQLSALSHLPVWCCEEKPLLGILLFWSKISVPRNDPSAQVSVLSVQTSFVAVVTWRSDAPDARDTASNALPIC